MLLDKFKWANFHGNWFAIFGVLNLLGYGLHLYSTKENYKYHFAYTGELNKIFAPFKSMIGSEHIRNIIWTAPALIGLNFYMHQRIGSLAMSKLFFLSLFSTYFFMSTFNPHSGANFRPLYHYLPKMDSNAEDGSYLMGADSMA